MRRRATIVLAVILASHALFLPVASAYVDPGSGSFIFQMLIGGLLAAGVGIKVFWKKIVSVFSRKGRSGDGS
jgi:hypothetical protein